MRRTGIRLLALALTLMVMPVPAFAAPSPSSRRSSDEDSSVDSISSDASTSVQGSVVTANGDILLLADVVIDEKRNVIGLVVDETSSGDETIEMNENSDEVPSEITVSILTGEAETNGLPESVIDTIDMINEGTLNIPAIDLSSYHAVSNAISLFLKDTETQEEVIRDTEVALYISAMPESGIDAVLFYNNYTEDWSLIMPSSVDTADGIVRFVIPCAGTTVMLTK